MASDAARQQVVLFGGVDGSQFGDTWVWEAGTARPSQRTALAWSASGTPSAATTSLTARWRAGAVGYPGATETPGATLQAWDVYRWIDVDTHSASPDVPADLCWTVRIDDTIPPPSDCQVTTDPVLLRRLFVGRPEELHFRVVPNAPNGTGIPGDPGRQWAALHSTYIEVTVDYRLPRAE